MRKVKKYELVDIDNNKYTGTMKEISKESDIPVHVLRYAESYKRYLHGVKSLKYIGTVIRETDGSESEIIRESSIYLLIDIDRIKLYKEGTIKELSEMVGESEDYLRSIYAKKIHYKNRYVLVKSLKIKDSTGKIYSRV